MPYPTDYRGGEIRDQIRWNLADNLTDLNIGVKVWVGLLAYWPDEGVFLERLQVRQTRHICSAAR